jgi:phosphoribosyl-AMP cyclohydrolase / phosphoribosyl-ATP pyrophosphohydrolase
MLLQPDFTKNTDGLVPVIIQDSRTRKVVMQGYMNAEAFAKTKAEGRVTFWSRSKQRLWTKGETSGHFLNVDELLLDCDQDALLIKATPSGPVCHTGSDTCWQEKNTDHFLFELERLIHARKNAEPELSYTAKLFSGGINKIAQKVGEEAVELIIEAKDDNRELFLGEAADLLYHYLVLLAAKECSLQDVMGVLERRGQ